MTSLQHRASSPPTRPWPRSSGPSAPSILDLDIRPIRHRTEDRGRAHVFLRMPSIPTWHMQARLAPVLFTDDDKPAASAARTSPVAPARPAPPAPWPRPPPTAGPPATSPCTTASPPGSPTSATICRSAIALTDPALPGFRLVATPTALHRQALELLGVSHRLRIA